MTALVAFSTLLAASTYLALAALAPNLACVSAFVALTFAKCASASAKAAFALSIDFCFCNWVAALLATNDPNLVFKADTCVAIALVSNAVPPKIAT